MKVVDMSFSFEFNFNIDSQPNWLKDQGRGSVKVDGCSITLSLTPINRNGIMQIEFFDVKLNLRDYHIDFEGNSDLSKAIHILLSSFKTFFKRDLANMLSWRLAKSVEETLNKALLGEK